MTIYDMSVSDIITLRFSFCKFSILVFVRKNIIGG